jgi:hypothetical protein
MRPIMRVLAVRDRVYTTHGGEVYGSEIAKEIRVCPKCDGQVAPIMKSLNAADATTAV